MRIQHFEVIGFGPFQARTVVEFPAAGLSVVLGPNESGKSMLVSAIFGTIFGLSAEEVERFRGWYGPAEYEGRVRLQLDDRDVEIIRYFDTQVAEIWDLTPTRRCLFSGDAHPGSKDTTYFVELGKLLGFHDAEIATGTTFVTHRDVHTRVSDKLRQMISGSKRADYDKILGELRARYGRLTRQGSGPEGLIERLEAELSRLQDARQQVEEALRTSFRLQGEIRTVEEQVATIESQVEEEARALEGLNVLEGLLREERALEERVAQVQAAEATVRQLQQDLAYAIDRVATEHAPLLPLQPTFLEDVHMLGEARREEARVQKELDAEKTRRAELQSQLKKVSEELTTSYGAFTDLPQDFPEKLSLFAARERELDALTAELGAVEKRIHDIDTEIRERHARFVGFEDDYVDELRALEQTESDWRHTLSDLEEQRARRQATEAEIHTLEARLAGEFLPYRNVADDFPSRLRNWHTWWEGYTTRKAQVDRMRDEADELEGDIRREHSNLIEAPPGYGDALRAWRGLRERLQADVPRLEKERETLQRLHQERLEASADIDRRYAALKDQVRPDFPEKLRELRRVKEEFVNKKRLLEEARERLTMAEDVLLNRHGRFLEKESDWGARLEEHRKSIERWQGTLDRLDREEEQHQELRRELDQLSALALEESEVYEGVSDSFPELLREYSRLKPEVDAREKQIADLKDQIHQLEELALREYSEFFGVGDDFAERIVQYRTDRDTMQGMATDIAAAQEEARTHQQRLMALDAALLEQFPHFKEAPVALDRILGAMARHQAELNELEQELNEALLHLSQLNADNKGRGRKTASLSMLIGGSSQAQRVKDIAFQEGRIAGLRAQMEEVEREFEEGRLQLGTLAERGNLEQLQAEFGAYQKMQAERNAVAAQYESAEAAARKLQEASTQLDDKLTRQRELLELASEADTVAMLGRYKDYQAHMARLTASRKVLKSHSVPVKGEDGRLTTELERNQKRLTELATALGTFAARFSGDTGGYDEVVRTLIEGFRTYKRRKQETEKLKARLSNLPADKERVSARAEAEEQLARERSQLELGPHESLDALIESWHDYEKLLGRIEAEEAIIRSHEQEMVEGGPAPVSRLHWLSTRMEALGAELGELAAAPDMDALIDDVNAYLALLYKIQRIDDTLSHLPPLAEVEQSLAAIEEDRRTALAALGLAPDATPDIDVMESTWKRFQKAWHKLENKREAVNALLETDEEGRSILDRMQAKLDDLAAGLGEFTGLSDLTDTLAGHEAFLSVRHRVKELRDVLEAMAQEPTLDNARRDILDRMVEERHRLGLGDDEAPAPVIGRFAEYQQLVQARRTEAEVRTRILSTVSTGDRSDQPAEAVLAELQQQLEQLRESLGGFEEAGEEADEVIAQFREAEQLKREMALLRTQLAALRTPTQVEEAAEAAREPVAALERKLRAVGDLSDVEALRARFRVFEELQQSITTTRRALEQHPTLEALAATEEGLAATVQEAQDRISTLLSERPTLNRWFEKYSNRFEELRPALTHTLDRLRENASVLELALEKTRATWRQHTQLTSGARGNLSVLDEQIERRQKDLSRSRIQRDGLKLAIDMLDGIVKDTQGALVGSLQIRAQEILRDLTQGRYSEMLLEGTQLEPVLKTPQGATIRGEALTGGLRDLLFFALRAAMAQEMAGNVRLPFILDDPFLQLDRTRLQNARDYLKALAERTQVILFSHDERCRDWGSVALELGPQAAESVQRDGEPTRTASTVSTG